MFCYLKATYHTGGHGIIRQTRREGCYGWTGFVYTSFCSLVSYMSAAVNRSYVLYVGPGHMYNLRNKTNAEAYFSVCFLF